MSTRAWTGFAAMSVLWGIRITYVNPVVAVALGVTILGERPGAGAVAELLLILAGSWLSTDGRLPPGLAAVIARRRRRRGRLSRPRPRSGGRSPPAREG